ncbi:MAG: hypothetical protein C5B51_13565 [Terriglobia bacterium]|nr:MAG: hypothetical protein C5B51_13565 [Terriglobia bacterium]
MAANKLPERQELENLWRGHLREARVRYEEASRLFRATWGEHFERRLTEDPTFAIQNARQAEVKALNEYVRVLKIFTDLVLHGKVPDVEDQK